MGSRMTGADGDHLPMPARRDPWFAMADFLAKEAETLKTDPGFAAEVNTAAHRLAIPLPAAVVSDRTCSAVARRCSDLVASGELRQAAALLAGHRLAIERWFRLHGARWRTDRVCPGCALLPCTALRESAAGRLTLFDTAASKGAD